MPPTLQHIKQTKEHFHQQTSVNVMQSGQAEEVRGPYGHPAVRHLRKGEEREFNSSAWVPLSLIHYSWQAISPPGLTVVINPAGF